MATWVYNGTAANGLQALQPANAAAPGGPLAQSGNTLETSVDRLAFRSVLIKPPGASWSAMRTINPEPRQILWKWVVVATSEANLNTVEALIESYLADGRDYVLSDGTRSNDNVVMDSSATRRVGRRKKLPDGRFRQEWQIGFLVLRPINSATRF